MITYQRQLEIQSMVNSLLKTHNLLTPPISLFNIVRAENITYYEENLASLGMDNADAFLYRDSQKKVIVINTNEHLFEVKKRFSLAHELGHLFLHTREGQQYIEYRNGIYKDPIKEEEANFFAACILMPTHLVEEEYFRMTNPFLSQLATKFNVSLAAMRYRLEYLGLSYINV